MTRAVNRITSYALFELFYIRVFAFVRIRNRASSLCLGRRDKPCRIPSGDTDKNGKICDLAVYSFTHLDMERKTV